MRSDVTYLIRENWTTFIQFGHDKLVQKCIQTVIGIFFKELSKKAGGIIGDLVSPDELNPGEDQAVIAWRMEQELTNYLNSRPSMCLSAELVSPVTLEVNVLQVYLGTKK